MSGLPETRIDPSIFIDIFLTCTTRTATPTTTTKNNSKYNNCTMECIEMSTCTELSLKLDLEKFFLRVLAIIRTLQQKRSRYLFGFMEKYLSFFLFIYKVYGEGNKTLITRNPGSYLAEGEGEREKGREKRGGGGGN